MKRNILVITALIISITGIIGYKLTVQSAPQREFTIGIVQTASHPALDAARRGFVTTLQEKLGDRIGFIEQNAQGSVDTLQAIAQRMHNKSTINALYAIATPALQALASAEHSRPIVFAAVSNPSILNLPTTDNIAGVTDMVSAHKQVELITQLTPAVRTVALVYNTSELNSVHAASSIEKELNDARFTVLKVGIHSEVDIPAAVDSACRNADALIAPADNSVASAINTISAIALKYNKPLFVSDGLLVEQGALASYGINYEQCGKQAAQIMYELLVEHKTPHDIGTVQPENPMIMINQNSAEKIGIDIPQSLRSVASIVTK